MFTSLINRSTTVAKWEKIPWHDPEFSRRMLAEHLSQAHDRASRRFDIIDQQVAWIYQTILKAQPATILDLGCGPGFYASRFAALGHTCTGIDFSPASIVYARERHPDGNYILADLLTQDFGAGYDLVTLIYGELNAFSPDEAERIVGKARAALKPGGSLLLEVHPADFVQRLGQEPPSWYTAQSGLFGDEPYLCLSELSYAADRAVFRYFVYAGDTGALQQYVSMLQSYTDDGYRRLLDAFAQVQFYPSLTGSADRSDLFAIVAEK